MVETTQAEGGKPAVRTDSFYCQLSSTLMATLVEFGVSNISFSMCNCESLQIPGSSDQW